MLWLILLAVHCFSAESRYAGIRKWLSELNVKIENMVMDMKVLFINIGIFVVRMNIFDIDIKELSAIPGQKNGTDAAPITINAIFSANLYGNLLLTITTYKDEPADLNATMINGTLKLTLQPKINEHGIIYEILNTTNSDFTIENLTMEMRTTGDSKNATAVQNLLNVGKNMMPKEFTKKMKSMIFDSIYDLLNNTVNPALLTTCDLITPLSLEEPKEKKISVEKGMFDLRESQIFDAVHYLLSEFIGMDGKFGINKLINKITNNTGVFSASEIIKALGLPTPFNLTVPLPDMGGEFNFTLNEFKISGLNTWTKFNFFNVINPYKTETQTALTKLGFDLDAGIALKATDGMLNGGQNILYENFGVRAGLNNNAFDLNLQIASPEGSGNNYTSTMCFEADCLAKVVSGKGTGITFLKLETDVDKIEYNHEVSTLDKDIEDMILSIADYALDIVLPVFTPALKGFSNYLGTEIINSAMEKEISEANCTYKDDPKYSDVHIAVTCGVFGAAILLTLVVLGVIIYLNQYDKQQVLMTLQADAPLVATNKIPFYARIGIVLLILANIALFISSNTGIGASVFIKFFIHNKKVEFPSMFDFGLINSIVDMWHSHAYFLSILIAVMSCIWPYTKLLLMLLAWFLPGKIFPPFRRKKMLEVLDALGKWSLVDSFVMVLMLVAFHLKIDFPVSNLVEESLSLNLFVYPAYGFITLILGTLFSLALSHIMLALDRYADILDNPPNKSEEENSGVFFGLTEQLWVSVSITALIIADFIFLFFGVTINSFSFQFVGLAGWGMKELDKDYKRDYSLITLGARIPEAAEFPNSFTVRFTQILYFLITIVIPALHLICLAVTWICPFSKYIQRKLHVASEILFAWSTIDVFVISILAAVLEISQLADFMVGDKCDLINPLIKLFFSDFDQIRGGYEKCFGVVTKVETGVWVLVVAAIFHDAVTIIVNHFVDVGLNGSKRIKIGNENEDKSDMDECLSDDTHSSSSPAAEVKQGSQQTEEVEL